MNTMQTHNEKQMVVKEKMVEGKIGGD